MALDVEVPDPPSLRGPQTRGEYDAVDVQEEDLEDDYRREELETFFAEGAWQDAFEEWVEVTELGEAEFAHVDRTVIDRFDFYWDPSTDEVGYRAPELSADQRAELSAEDADLIESELDTLGRVVTETLENDYLLRDDEEWGFFAEEYTDEDYGSRDEG